MLVAHVKPASAPRTLILPITLSNVPTALPLGPALAANKELGLFRDWEGY